MASIELPRELHDHWVQFYETESFLADKVVDFLLQGLCHGEAAIVIATRSHCAAFVDVLRSHGFDTEGAIAREDLMILDASATLETFMVGGSPDWGRFEGAVGGKLEVLSRAGTRGVRAYGEMVDVLWRDGRRDAAIRLEEQWNELRARRDFKLLCAYVMDSFYKEDGVPRICATHSHVLSPERSGTDMQSSPSANLHALIAEISRRTEVEATLRASLRDLRRSEEEVRASKEDLEDFVGNAAIAIHRVDRDGVIRYVNRMETQLFGYSEGELLGRHVAELHVDREVIEDILARLMRGETVRDREARVRTKDGSIRYVQITSNVQMRDGQFVSSRCFTRDVTSARQTAVLHGLTAALSRALTADEVLETVVDESRTLIGAPAGAVILLNDAGTEIQRFRLAGNLRESTAATVQALPLSANMPICEAARTSRLVWVVGASALDARYPNLTAIRLTEQIQTWGAVPIVFEGRTLGAIGFRCGFERPLLAEEELMLIAIGRQCGLAMERARLHEAAELARRQAERASRAKDEFLAMLGHELRNPLSPILTAVQLMRLRGDDATAREQNIIERQVNHLIHLVDDLLDISRITEGKVQLDRRPIKVANVITRAMEIVGPQCEDRGHQLVVEVPAEEIWIEADETRLCQVVTNLLANAVKYTSPGGRLRLRVAHDREQVSVIVNDNGAGIAPELLPRVFDLFVQGERSTDRSRGGLGIGLALVRNLVTMHGGTVSASSEGLGRGSQFVVRLPMIDLRRAPASPDPERRIRKRVEVTPRKILVVDDNQDAAELLAEMLRNVGHEVAVVHEGQHALDMIKHFKPEIAILDIGLPDMDGYQVARSLRGHLGPSVRLMAVTGYGQERDRARAELAGFDHHFTKPVGLSKVLAAIEVEREVADAGS